MSIIEAPVIPKEPLVLTEEEKRLLDAARHLRNAERYMRDHGWGRGRAQSPVSGRVCILGALYYGNAGKLDLYGPEYDALCKAIGAIGTGGPVGWNDYVCQSEEEALGMLRQARELVASGGAA